MSKRYLYYILVVLLALQSNFALAEKLVVTKHDEFIEAENNIIGSEGDKVYLDQFEGSAILLVFWATWCGSCVNELPALDNLQKDFRKLPFKIVAVSEDYQGLEVVKKYFSDNEIRFLEAYHDPQNKLFRELSIVGLPTAYLINPEGKIKYIFNGSVKWQDDEIRRVVLAEISGNPVLPKNTYKSASLNIKVGKVDQASAEPAKSEVPPPKKEDAKVDAQQEQNKEQSNVEKNEEKNGSGEKQKQ
ncbi:MAG: redoxin domain-containing protein [Rickettsiales bacterium]|nr:redoxin domain-containing protein [Rickettsiales bacterium]MCA0254889.1 TlpA family protein disulfide reductase [Pseudomonadota bacterium]